MERRSLVCLTNIPTPYRLFQFRLMSRELGRRGWDFEAWFMAKSEPNRNWVFDKAEFDFPHRFLRGAHFAFGSDSVHCNPEVGRHLKRMRPEVLLVAGSWTNPTSWLAKAASSDRRVIFWSESHLSSTRRNGVLARGLRRSALRQFKEFAVPGKLAEEYVKRYGRPQRIYRLPNLVDPALFHDEVRDIRKAAADHCLRRQRCLLIPARLTREKGLLPFMEGLAGLEPEMRRMVSVSVAGTGPLRESLERWISAHDLDIRLLGHYDQNSMLRLYAQTDGFCLPSLSDPNPLSTIEALWAGLPLLLSSRVGNHPECLTEAQNGFLFDPGKPLSVAEAVSRWLKLSALELEAYRVHSTQIARRNFSPEENICGFLDAALPQSNSHQIHSASGARSN